MFFDNLLSKYLMFKSSFDGFTVFCYLPKLKRGLGLVFGAHFLHTFPIQMFLILYSVNWPIRISDLLFFSRHQTICVLRPFLGSWWRHKLWDLSLINIFGIDLQGEKIGGGKCKNVNILWMRFLDEIASIFHNSLRTFIW